MVPEVPHGTPPGCGSVRVVIWPANPRATAEAGNGYSSSAPLGAATLAEIAIKAAAKREALTRRDKSARAATHYGGAAS